MTDPSHLVLTNEQGITVVGFASPTILNSYNITEISDQLFDLIDKQGHKLLVMDFSTIIILCSQTLGVLLKMRKKLDEVEGKMVICGIDPGLYRVFKITRLEDLFEFYEDKVAAVDSLR